MPNFSLAKAATGSFCGDASSSNGASMPFEHSEATALLQDMIARRRLPYALSDRKSGLMSLVSSSLAFDHHVVDLLDAIVVPVSVEREAAPNSVHDASCPDVPKFFFQIHQQLRRAAGLG